MMMRIRTSTSLMAAALATAAIISCSDDSQPAKTTPGGTVVAPSRDYLDTPVAAARPAREETAAAMVTMGSPPPPLPSPPVAPPAVQKAPVPAEPASDGGTTARFLGLAGPIPATWIAQQPQGDMYKAMYTVPGVDGADAATIVVFHFGSGDRGTVQMNIDRWAGQFRSPDGGPVEPIVSRFESDEMPITLVELAGAYQGMGMDSFRPDHLFLSAIIEAPIGKVYVRFVGPARTVQANREAYLGMLQELRRIAMTK
jgi:hypothetical protein